MNGSQLAHIAKSLPGLIEQQPDKSGKADIIIHSKYAGFFHGMGLAAAVGHLADSWTVK